MKKIVLRADGNSAIGLGHVYRLLSIANITGKDFDVCFVINNPEPFLLELLKMHVNKVISLNEKHDYSSPSIKDKETEIAFDMNGILTGEEIVVLDGYWFGKQYQQAVKASGCKLVCIDDFATNHFFADVVINHAPGIQPSLYSSEPYTKFCLGLDYAMLRNEFYSTFAPVEKREKVLLISMGGSDEFKLTGKFLPSIINQGGFKAIHILISPLFDEEHLNLINHFASNTSLNIKLHRNLNAKDLVHIMDSCTHAFVSASTVLFEAYSRGLICITGYYTGNQLNIYNGFTSQKLAHGLGDLKALEQIPFHYLNNSTLIPFLQPMKSDKNLKNIFLSLC